MRLAILKEVKGGQSVVLEYREDQVHDRLQKRVRENLAATESAWKRKWTKDEVADSLVKAWDDLVSEFKEETVKLP